MEVVHDIHVSETFIDHAVSLVNRTREHPAVELGCSPRAGITQSGVAARRWLSPNYVIPADLYALAEDALLHRMRLTYESLAEGYTGADLLKSLLHEFGANSQRNGR